MDAIEAGLGAEEAPEERTLAAKGEKMRRLVFALPLSFVALLLGSRPSAQSGSLVVTAVTIDYVAQTITIRGSGFGTIAPSVSLSGTALTLQSFSSTSQVIVASLPGVTPGSYDLRITAGQNKVTDFDVTIGSTGPQGPPGSQGAIGPSGPQGSTGPLGPQGPQGLKGDVGSPGPKGETGAQGVKGDPGPTGAQGDPGAAGSAGIQGPIGLTGPTGPQGPAGIDGAPFGLPFSGTYSTGGITPAFHIDGGSGVGAQFSNNSSDWPALQAFSFGDGRALEVRKKIGTAGSAAFFSNAGDGPVLDVHAAGNGRAAQFVIDSTSNPSAALFAANPNLLGWAASFQGNVEVTGGLTINGQPAGLQGPIGPAGPQGSQGPKGDPGGTGPLGPAGATGAVGPAGPQGPAGVPFALPFQGADTSDADAIFITKGGNHGAATVLESVSPTNSSTAFTVYNFGTGTASDSRNFNQTSTAVALAATHFGLGGAGAFAIDNPANPAAALTASTNGTGNAAQFFGNVDVSGALTVNGLPIGQQGPAGPQGPPGPQGAQGLAGPQGPQGPTGPSSSACHRIESIPYQISSPGVYCLVSDLETSMTAGTAITIASGNVTLDLQGFTLRNLAGATQAFAIKNADGILVPLTVIRNGRLANFLQSVMINSPGDSRVLIEQLEIYNSLGVAIEVHGDMADVRNNRVYSVGGSATSPGFAFGILASGTRCRVRGNWVENVFASAGGGEAIGIAVSGSEIRISDNAILSVYGSPVLNTGITCQGTAIRITGNDVVIPTGLPGYAWNSVAGVPCQDLGGNTYSGLPPG